MFQYSTETIINSNKGNLPLGNGVRYAAVTMGSAGMTAGTDAFLVDGVGLYHKDNIKKVTVARYVAEKNEVITIALPITSGDADKIYRLAVYTSQEGLSSSTYADAQLFHKKPFFYEVKLTGTKATDTQAFADLINKEMRATDFNYFKASVASTGELVLTADDCYTRFQKVHVADVNLAGNITGWEDYTPVLEWERNKTVTGIVLTPGTEGAGTVRRLIKNLRVPTDANTNVFGADTGGKPVPGGKYDQVTIEYVTTRKHIGGQVLGSIDHSLTTHTFFVIASFDASNDPVASDFETELAKVHAVDETIDPARPVPTSKVGRPIPGSKQ